MACEVTALVRSPVPLARLQRTARRVLRSLHLDPRRTDLSIALVDDRRMRQVNARYRRRSTTTDVLSFPGSGSTWGEIMISVPQARRQALRFHQPVSAELNLLLVHGLLHLAGYTHTRTRDRRRMAVLEARLLRGSSLVRRADQR